MAFDAADLTLANFATGGGFLYSYVTTDDLATVNSSGYWHAGKWLLRPGDQVAVTASDGKFFGLVNGGVSTPGVFNRADVTTFHLE